jgi:MFS family permease
MCTGSANLFNAIYFAVFYVLLARDLHVSPGLIGVIMSTSAIGGLIGSLLTPRIAARFGQGPTIWISVLVAAPTSFVAPFLHRDWTLVLLAAAQILFWATTVVYNITQVSFRQGLCPPALLGRMNATMRFLVWGTMPLGGLVGGVLGSTIGVRPTLLVAAIGSSLCFLPVFLSPLRSMRELPVYEEPGEEALIVSQSGTS